MLQAFRRTFGRFYNTTSDVKNDLKKPYYATGYDENISKNTPKHNQLLREWLANRKMVSVTWSGGIRTDGNCRE